MQAKASLNNQKVNLDHTVITAPIDGIVISRSVDQGQTVAASMNAPTLFILAADLTKMQVLANIDEADVGRMRPGQDVTFRVDAFPTETFHGTVQQVRLQPHGGAERRHLLDRHRGAEPELKLKPGMTANVSIEVARKQQRAARAGGGDCASGRPRTCSWCSTRKCRPRRAARGG